MKVLTDKNWVALDRLRESKYNQVRSASEYQQEKERKGLFDAGLKIAGAQYQQAREVFSGSDSEEELPRSPRD